MTTGTDWIESGDPEFDQWEASSWEALEKSGNAEGLSREEARIILAKRLTEFAGRDLSHLFTEAPKKKTKGRKNDDPIAGPPLALRVPTPGPSPYWYEAPGQSELIDHFISARRALGYAMTGGLLITGPSGSGKSMGVMRRAKALGLPFLKMDTATITDPQKWFGRREIDAKGSRYEESTFVTAAKSGSVILLDEFNRAHPSISNPIFAALDGSQSIHLSDLGVDIAVHPETVFIATANIGSQFGGTYKIDHAMRRRFPYSYETDFPPEADEVKVLTSMWPQCDPDAATLLVSIAADSRVKYANGDIRVPIDTATLTHAAMLVASGMDERTALEYTVLPMYDKSADGQLGAKSERAIVKGMIDLSFRSA